jgi:hypothetical protein
MDAEHVSGHQFQGNKYDRDHVTVGQQGRGAEAVHSKVRAARCCTDASE